MTNSKRIGQCLVVVTLTGLLAVPVSSAQTNDKAELVLQAAIHKQLVEGDLEGAIQQYKSIVASFSGNRGVASKALLEMGQCYEKLGNDEARKAYERVLRDYADQSEAASQARTRLAALSGGAKTIEMVTRRVWAGTDWDNLGPPSLDGRFFPCSDWETGGDLAVCDLTTGKKRRLTSKSPQSPEAAHTSLFSPDGKRIAYSWDRSYASSELRVVGLDGSKPRVIYSSNELRRLWPYCWSPDGKHILTEFNRKQDHSHQLVWVAVADGSLQEVKTFGTRYPLRAIVSPDGRFIAYDFPQQKESQNRDIYIVSSDGRQDIPLIQHPANEYLLGWTPDGTGVLFASDRTGSWDAWGVKVSQGRSQGAPEIVKKDIGQVSPLGFARNGSFYYSLDANKSDLYLAALDLTTGKVLTPPSPVSPRFVGSNSGAAWSPDGQYLAYFSIRGDANSGAATITLRIRSLQNGEERELFPKLHNLYGTRWFPDGRFIAVSGFDTADHQGLYRIDVQTGEVSPISRSEEGARFYLGQLSPDGKTIFYAREEEASGTSTIRSRDLTTGRESELSRSTAEGVGVGALALSPDGQQLAFTLTKMREYSSLNVMSATGGEPRELLTLKKPEMIPFDTVNWTPDGRELVFAKARFFDHPPDFKTELWRISTQSGQPQKLDLAGDGLRRVRFHPDGKRVTFNSGTLSSEIWVLENFLPKLRAAK